jgi:hypothetical protein
MTSGEAVSATAADYRLREPAQNDRVRIDFPGRFQGREVLWQATLITLDRYYQNLLQPTGLPADAGLNLRQFIEIEPVRGTRRIFTINIGLDVTQVDHPTILKTIIMVRNYKRLEVGRHEYGEAKRFPRA